LSTKLSIIYNGKIYKCSTAGLLEDTLSRFGNPNISEWGKYIDPGLPPNKNIDKFINNFNKPHPICGQCPSKNDSNYILNHISSVTIK